jgi:hypothetical protein
MAKHTKLPVFEVVGEAFVFAWRKFPAIIVLNLTAVLFLAGPVLLLGWGLYVEFFGTLDPNIKFLPAEHQPELFMRIMPIAIFYMAAAFLISPVIYTVIISHLVKGKSLWLPKLNFNTLRYFFTSAIISFSSAAVLALASAFYLLIITALSHTETYNVPGSVIAAIFMTLVAFYFIVRFSLVPIDVIAESKIGISKGYAVSKGHFWRLLGMYMVMLIVLLVIMLIMGFVLSPIQQMLFKDVAEQAADVPAGDAATVLSTFSAGQSSPGLIAYNIFTSLLQIYLAAVMVALPAIAYVRITE